MSTQPRDGGRFARLDPQDVYPDPGAFKVAVVAALQRNRKARSGPRTLNELAEDIGTTGGALRPRLDGHRPLPRALAQAIVERLGLEDAQAGDAQPADS